MRKNKQLATLPEHLSYSTVRIESPLGKVIYLPRRELFDVRAQLLQENSSASDQVVENLDKSDLRSGIYEGGFKTWECSIDLSSFLLDRGPRKDIDELVKCDQILEVFVTIHSPYIRRRTTCIIDMRLTHTSQLGAGSALPSLILFRHAVLHSLSDLTFTLADYNEEVLRLITLPNLILTWAATTTTTTISPESNSNNMNFSLTEPSNGDFELTPSLLSNFKTSLQSTNLTLNFLSGPWSPALANLILPSSPSSPSPSPSFSVGEKSLLILASETIYSPTSTAAFVDLVTTLLKRRGGGSGSGSGGNMGKAVLGAKKMYFGVGGSVDGLKEMCRDRGAVACEVENSGVKGMEGDGVGRALVEIQMF